MCALFYRSSASLRFEASKISESARKETGRWSADVSSRELLSQFLLALCKIVVLVAASAVVRSFVSASSAEFCREVCLELCALFVGCHLKLCCLSFFMSLNCFPFTFLLLAIHIRCLISCL